MYSSLKTDLGTLACLFSGDGLFDLDESYDILLNSVKF
ncbi:hypothetical protein COO91_00703 [Nostoc flagelliforme CCNUN1]|uniref:Uncharacterized protein n=1 Tax=Nostoc flagelliforme CCNUN1 TaxID=2038116 RepID=A0A2K8SJ70_9NOSO|nr:hypothetical protein COO91_00703 [Nostoc flagelliforme CCNUN1]